MPSNFKALAGASGGEPTDANFKNVTLLLHGDGSNGAQNNTFLDSSTNNFTITRNGNTTQGSFSPYGSNWSNYFDGSGDYLTAPDNAALQLGSSDFAIEFWVNFSVVPGASQGATLVSKFDTSNTGYEVILYNNTMYFQAQTASIGMTYAWTPTAGRWYHIAWTRSGSNSYGFIDGALVASTSGASGSITNLAQALQLGRRGDNTFYLNGYLSNVRVVKGSAVYTSAFTPSTAPLTAITNTSLLTCQSNRFRDASTNNFTITRNGDVKVTNFAPFAPSSAYSTTTNGGSAYFDGSGDYLSVADNAAFGYGTGDFTIEFWLFANATSSQTVVSNLSGVSSTNPHIYIDGTIRYYTAGADRITGATIAAGQWYHIALCRSSGSTKLFINGTQSGATYSDANNYGSSAPLGVGTYWSGGSLVTTSTVNGYLSNVRIVKGTAVYTAAFTPPTAPVTAITNTSLLLNATNAAIFDNSMKNDLETVGNAQVSTAVSKFGGSSMYFDGTGDYLVAPDSANLELGSGDFTIETWVYLPSLPASGGIYAIVSKWASTQYSYLTQIRNNAGTMQLGFAYSPNASSVTTVYANASITAATWHHCAWVRNGTSFKMFLNGTEVTSGVTISGSIADTAAALNVGRNNDNVEYLTGYLDDLRITRGVARYTTTFTPPTAAFANK